MSRTNFSQRTGFKLAGLGIIAALALVTLAQNPAQPQPSAQVRFGQKLFHETRFSSPQGDLQNSCASCHLLDEDPQGMRAHTDFFSRSWVPWRGADPRREGLRNAPTILDSALMPKLHFDGEFNSLEELVKGTLSGRPMGWLPGEEDQALDRVYDIIAKVSPGSATNYTSDFRAAYGVDPSELTKAEVVERSAKAVADYIRTQKSGRSTAYDRFVQINGLSSKRAEGEDQKAFAGRILAEIAALEKKNALRMTTRFGPAALKGLKVFFRTSGAVATGNCAACHAPPLFTDFAFHNMGISQSEYDRMNGDGAFAKLEIPDAGAARRPAAQFREVPSKRKPEFADLGHWNFVDLKTSPQRRAGESDDQFLRRMIASFKTPSLRNLAFTQPYMHTGGFSTLEGALSELIRLSELARAGHVRSADEELARIRITESDIAPLVTFLNTLNENLKPDTKYFSR